MAFPVLPVLLVAAAGTGLYYAYRPKEAQAARDDSRQLPAPEDRGRSGTAQPPSGRPAPREQEGVTFAPAAEATVVEQEQPQRGRRPGRRRSGSILDVPSVRAHINKMKAEGASSRDIAAWLQTLKKDRGMRHRMAVGALPPGVQLPPSWGVPHPSMVRPGRAPAGWDPKLFMPGGALHQPPPAGQVGPSFGAVAFQQRPCRGKPRQLPFATLQQYEAGVSTRTARGGASFWAVDVIADTPANAAAKAAALLGNRPRRHLSVRNVCKFAVARSGRKVWLFAVRARKRTGSAQQ